LALARTFGPPLLGPAIGLLLLGLRDTNAVREGLRTRPRRNRDDRENCSGKDQAVTCHFVSSPLIAELIGPPGLRVAWFQIRHDLASCCSVMAAK
jgi:hypothetical protein